jgi:hypothetical protein
MRQGTVVFKGLTEGRMFQPPGSGHRMKCSRSSVILLVDPLVLAAVTGTQPGKAGFWLCASLPRQEAIQDIAFRHVRTLRATLQLA